MEANQPRQHPPSADKLVSDANSECSEILKQQEMLILDLSPEIIALILIRLSVKTLSILKCVNKYFSRFVSCPDFIRDHLKLSIEDASMSGYKVMIKGVPDSQLKQTSIQSFCHETQVVNFVNLDYPERELDEIPRLVGSCNGLVVVIVNREHWFLWNPTIRKHKKLPNVVGHEYLNRDVVGFYYGFGFDASNDEYKVVELIAFKCLYSKSRRDIRHVVNVYSLKRNSWIRIPDFTAGEFMDSYGMFVSGKLHWCTTNGDIVSFDVEREVFGTLEHPNYVEGLYSPLLCVLGGSITVCCGYGRHVDVWVMKEYGSYESWNKMFTLSDNFGWGTEVYSILPNGEVLTSDGSLRIYDPRRKSWRLCRIHHYNDTIIYVESLVSPCCN